MSKEKCCCSDAVGKDHGRCGNDCNCKETANRVELSDIQVRNVSAQMEGEK